PADRHPREDRGGRLRAGDGQAHPRLGGEGPGQGEGAHRARRRRRPCGRAAGRGGGRAGGGRGGPGRGRGGRREAREEGEEVGRLVVGLGNPGERYRRTRHNAGFMVADALAARSGVARGREEPDAWVAEATVMGEDVDLVKPYTFMNRTG